MKLPNGSTPSITSSLIAYARGSCSMNDRKTVTARSGDRRLKWPRLRLEELAAREQSAIKIGPFGSQLKRAELVNSGIHVVGIENVLQNKFDGLGDRYITHEKFKDLLSVEVKPGDIL